ncbi:MAG: iron ABC transporter permease [Chitinophagales bacterium]|nr:iron ABC transporter permease [Chitinophagales bacterium]
MKLKQGFFFSIALLCLASLHLFFDYDLIWSHHQLVKYRVLELLTAIFASVALGVSGLYLQWIFNNKLASPYVLGISPFVSLLVTMSISFGLWKFIDTAMIYYSVLLLLSWLVIYGLITLMQHIRRNQATQTYIVIVGLLLGMFANSFEALLKMYIDNAALRLQWYWQMGSFSKYNSLETFSFMFLVFMLILGLFRLSHQANLIQLGKIYAHNLGLDYERFFRQTILLVAGLVSLVTIFCGPIGFIGLVSPHIASLINPQFNFAQKMMFTSFVSAIFGVTMLLFSIHNPLQTVIPLNIISSVLGVPLVFWILMRSNK